MCLSLRIPHCKGGPREIHLVSQANELQALQGCHQVPPVPRSDRHHWDDLYFMCLRAQRGKLPLLQTHIHTRPCPFYTLHVDLNVGITNMGNKAKH